MVAQQPDARDILDRAADAFRREGGIKITFSVRAPEGNSNGSIRLKGDKFLLGESETANDVLSVSRRILDDLAVLASRYSVQVMKLMFPNLRRKNCRALILIHGCRSIIRIIN